MSYTPGVVGNGYLQSVLRVEHRPTDRPHTRQELLDLLDTLQEAGVGAWWTSVSAKGSYPLFPSKILPYRQDVATDLYPWLVEEGHRRGIAMFSWEYLNTAPLLTEQHPEWRVRYLDDDSRTTPRDDHFVCFCSPYGELLKDYCVEVVNDLGFDGIWFDGSYMFAAPKGEGRLRWTCCCEFCAKAFREATGLAIPRKVDWKDPVFQAFIAWRYDFFEGYWVSLADHVRARNPHALIAFNTFNRGYALGAVSGSPLRHRPMDALIAGEGTTLEVQMLTRTQRAISSTYPVEVWTSLHDGVHLGYPARPNPEPTSSIYYAQAAATAGGYASFGIGVPPRDVAGTLKDMAVALEPIASYIGGEPERCCGLVLSGATKDFASRDIPKEEIVRHAGTVNAAYGLGFLLDQLHYPFEIVLDNQLDAGSLKPYKAVVLPDVRCMSDASAAGLREYVAAGGTLLVIGESGLATETGDPREKGALDGLLGITGRSDQAELSVIEPQTDLLRGRDRSPRWDADASLSLPDRYMISGLARLVEVAADVTVLATASHNPHVPGARMLDGEQAALSPVKGVVAGERRVGHGRVIFLAASLGEDFAQNTNRRTREVVRRLLSPVAPSFTTDAPAGVQVVPWRQDGRLVFHLLNLPATMQRIYTGVRAALHPEDFTPTGPVRVRLSGRAGRVFSPTVPDGLQVEQTGDRIMFSLDRLVQHAVVVLEGQATEEASGFLYGASSDRSQREGVHTA